MLSLEQMETGVHGEIGLSVQRRVLGEQRHEIDIVTIQHQQMTVLLAKDRILKRYHALQLSHAQYMETGVRGEAGVSVQRHVLEEQGHGIEPVIIL